jgi:hypothetical protein
VASASFISGVDGNSVKFSGPIFDGRALAACEALTVAAKEEIGKEGVTMIQSSLDQVLQHPTGYYRSQIQYDTAEADTVIGDGGVVYGPWLEGVGSRNSPVTRFPGYHTFRDTYPKLQKKAEEICLSLLRGSFLARMNE